MPKKTIILSEEDLLSIQRLLAGLSSPDRGHQPPSDIAPEQFVKLARASLALRKRRTGYFHRAMLGEPAYDMLLALYDPQTDETPVTATRLAEIAGVAPSSALRWIEYLVAKQLVDREPHPKHRRASVLTLSDKGREALEGVFRDMLESLRGVTS
ncbi:MAG: MarR family winged helix-turn-helix transcriptional regulator [Pseudomonadota bacterium]